MNWFKKPASTASHDRGTVTSHVHHDSGLNDRAE